MSKAILVLDEMPDNCSWCKLCDRLSTCMPTGYTTPLQDLDKGRLDWCPIRELPDHMADYNPEIHPANEPFDAGYTLGWNECLNQIEGDNTDE